MFVIYAGFETETGQVLDDQNVSRSVQVIATIATSYIKISNADSSNQVKAVDEMLPGQITSYYI